MRIIIAGVNSNPVEKRCKYFYYMEKYSRMFYNKESNNMNDSHKERRNIRWNVEMHGFLIQKQKKKN